MDNFSAFSSTVLLVKHFPLIFNSTDRQEFFGHFGATRTRNLKRYKNLWNIIVVDFSSPSIASQALMRLHQLEMLRRRLAVEYCPLELAKYAFSDISFVEERRDFEYDRIHGLSPGVNEIHYVLPRDRFSYEYPPIDESILENINEALWSVPAFYTQVLHLMNKMSLPCPMFHSRIRPSRSLSSVNAASQTDRIESNIQLVDMETDSNESEIDNGEEEKSIRRRQPGLFENPTNGSERKMATLEIDVTIDPRSTKKQIFEFHLPESLNPTSNVDEVVQGFGRIERARSASNVEQTQPTVDSQSSSLIPVSLENIVKNRLTEEQLRLFDNGRLYRNYERGNRSRRLYIKNLDVKRVDERILHSIFVRFVDEPNSIDVRLLREGKMKGQAFVSFSSESEANRALDETNGLVLFEKPMIVQFARSAQLKTTV